MKKQNLLISIGFFGVLICGCSQTKSRYVDLSTGKSIELVKDEKTGLMVSKETGQPVEIYVDTKSSDTIYGKTGEVINGHVIKMGEYDYVYDGDEKLKVDDGDVKYKDGDYKVKVEKDGDNKTKNNDTKIKVEGENDRKVKND